MKLLVDVRHPRKVLERLTVDGAVEVLVADFAGQMPNSSLLIDLGGNGVLMVTEEAWERGGEWLGLVEIR